MPPRDDIGALERARERLYVPQASQEASEELPTAPTSSFPRGWNGMPILRSIGVTRHVRLASRFFAFALIFFVVAIGAAVALFLTGSNTVSTDNVTLTVQGPTTVAGGDVAPLSVTVINKNPVAITNATIEIDFPDGTRSADDVTKNYPRYTENVGTLTPGASIERSVKAVLFGGQDTQITIPVSISYGVSGSNATFVKHSPYTLGISTAPLSVSVDAVSQTVSGKPLTLTATVRSNATAPISGVVLGVHYPAGFTLTASSVPAIGSNIALGTLSPGGTKKVTLTGVLVGQNNDQRAFQFTVGTAKSANDSSLAVSYMMQEADITIAAPFLATSITVNGSSADTPVVTPGSPVTVTVSWGNTLSVPVTNANIEVALSGSALDAGSIKTQSGFYRSSDRTVLFNRDTSPALANLPAGATGAGTFTFSTISAAAGRDSSITLALSISGEQGGSGATQVSASLTKVIKLASATSFTSASSRTSGGFSNSGPIPPKANFATTYTILWKVGNGANDAAGAEVQAVLPSYITFMNQVSPSDGSIQYDSASHMVSWTIGDLSAGASRQAAFQVALAPSTSQKGTTPMLTATPTFTTTDRFTQTQISLTAAPPTTETTGDPGYVAANAVVQ